MSQRQECNNFPLQAGLLSHKQGRHNLRELYPVVNDVGLVELQGLDPLRVETKLQLQEPRSDRAAVDRVAGPGLG